MKTYKPYSTTKQWINGALGATALALGSPITAKADYHTIDATVGNNWPQIRLIDTVKFDRFTYDGFNQATKSWYFGDNTIYGNTKVAPLVKLLSNQETLGKVVPGIRVSLPNASLDAGYLNGGIHTKFKTWTSALGLDWYLVHVTNAAPKNKPFSLTEIEATKVVNKHTGIVGRTTWTNFSGKPKLEIGARYIF